MPCSAAVNRKRKWILRIALALLLVLVVLAILAFAFPQKFLCVDSGPVKADIIVVLGGGHDRPERAAELFKEHDAGRVLISGLGDTPTNRIILMRDGVPANVIQMESKSRTTKENAQFTIAMLRTQQVHSVILVTSWYHSRRALATFEHYGSGIKFYSRPALVEFDRKDWNRPYERRIYLEYVKLAGYCLRYGVWPF